MGGYSEDMTMKISKLNRNQQRGAMGGYIMAILVISGLLTMGSKLIPLYMDHNTMATILDKMAVEQGLGGRTDSQLIDMLRQRFKLNNIRDFPIHEHVEFKRSGKGTEVIMDYEVRMHVIHNIDMIASFNKEIALRD